MLALLDALLTRHLSRLLGLAGFQHLARKGLPLLRIPVNVTADSGNVTGIPANVTDGSVLRVLILCRRAFPAGFLSPYSVSLEFAGPCQAAGGPPGHACTHA